MEIKVYDLFELDIKAVDKAMENVTFMLDSDYNYLAQEILDNAKKHLEFLGFYNIDICYSGFWSQGDGLAFSAKLDNDRLLDKLKYLLSKKYPNDVLDYVFTGFNVDIVQSHCGYICYCYSDYYSPDFGTNVFEDACDSCNGDLLELLEKFCNRYSARVYKQLRDLDEYINSYEYIIKYIKDNAIKFHADGSIY